MNEAIVVNLPAERKYPVPKWIPKGNAHRSAAKIERLTRAIKREAGRCIYCQLDLVTNTELLLSAELDHLVPREVFRNAAQPGYRTSGDYSTNLVFSCGPCNDAKENWPLCLSDSDRTLFLTGASREAYLQGARAYTISRRRSEEKRVAALMAAVWAQRASKAATSVRPAAKALVTAGS